MKKKTMKIPFSRISGSSPPPPSTQLIDMSAVMMGSNFPINVCSPQYAIIGYGLLFLPNKHSFVPGQI